MHGQSTRWLGSSALALGATLVFSGVAMAAEPAKPVTFTKDIAPIFQSKCESCHRADGMAPMSLVTYEDARPWAKSIASRVGARQMPPWHIDKTVGIQKFKNDRSLNDEQIETIQQWVAAGSPKGDPKDMPAPKVWADNTSAWAMSSKYGQPDLVVKSPEYTMPAVAQDAWWRPTVPTGLTEPRWVRAIEIRPVGKNARKITHHALARLVQPEDMDPALFTNDPSVAGDGLFMEWAVGKNGDEMRPDSGRLMLPNSKITWEMHYHAVGEEINAHTELAVWFYPKGQEPKHREVLALFNTFSGILPGGRSLDIPPNQVTTTESFVTLKENARIENFQAHMHLRGKGMSMEAIYPDGKRELLSQVTDFNFNWHNMYIYDDDVAPLLPKGTILHLLAWYDNTKANKSNPDPDQWVGWGDRTVDEMGHAWINITYYKDDEFKAEVAKRNAATSTANGVQQQ
jgi:mono/diheme cytochrome c family protein